ncbi:MAG: sigma-70 family RNA polymerase sigma factor [Christensenellales bacterium]|jgi:RNA polymerase sporulation-specific sigma factor|nr:sigma-70 family RNA polymerase sigma factor [Clostridiales bacterium]
MMNEATYAALSDEELCGLSQVGDGEAAEYLIGRYKPQVLAIARRYYLEGGDRDDLVQEGMIGLYQAIADFRNDQKAKFKTFCNLCIRRQLVDAMRKANAQKNRALNQSLSLNQSFGETGDEGWSLIADQSLDPEEALLGKEAAKDLTRYLQTALSKQEKATLSAFLKGHSYDLIAAQLGTNSKSVDNAIQRVRKKISTFLEERDM